jgi:hypothetical protein
MTVTAELPPAGHVRTPRAVRAVLLFPVPLVLLQGAVLFVLTEHTDRYFSWTIQPPLTAAFIGAVTFAGAALSWLSARQVYWVRARLAIVPVWLFWVVMGVVTLVHLDRFHFDSALPLTARLAAWVWIGMYTVMPIWFLVVVIGLLLRRTSEPPRSRPLPEWFRALLVLQGCLVALVASLLLFMTDRVSAAWPWILTPLTARAVGAWMLTTAALAIVAVVENDLDRMYPVAVTFIASGALQLVAVVRYLNDFEAASISGVGYLVFPASLLLLGVVTLRLRSLRLAGHDEGIPPQATPERLPS